MVVFQDREFQFAFERALGASYRGAADVGEVLATAGRITDGDANSWVHEWTSTAGEAWAAAGRVGAATGSLASRTSGAPPPITPPRST
jgi:hypothetical protein